MAVEQSLLASVPDSWLADRRDEAVDLAGQVPAEMLHTGSGWGALELQLRGEGGGFDRPATPFPAESCGSEQAAWVELLDAGRLPSADPSTPPSSYLVSAGVGRPAGRTRRRRTG